MVVGRPKYYIGRESEDYLAGLEVQNQLSSGWPTSVVDCVCCIKIVTRSLTRAGFQLSR